MHFAFLIFVSVLVGYGAGLGFEVLTDGDDSKIQRLLNENEVDPNWIPFGVVGQMYYNQGIVDSAYLEYYGTPGLIGVGYLRGDGDDKLKKGDYEGPESPISAASVAFDIGIREVQNNGKTSFQNVVDMCIFHSPDSFGPLCVICQLFDDRGAEDVLIGEGTLFEFREYIGSETEEIKVFSVPEVDPGMLAANDVQDVGKVNLEICELNCDCIKPTTFTVRYDGPDAETVKIFKKISKKGIPEDLIVTVSGPFESGALITIDSTDFDSPRDQVHSNTVYQFFDEFDNSIAGSVQIHTSCSKPLFIGDEFLDESGEITLTVVEGLTLGGLQAIPDSVCKA